MHSYKHAQNKKNLDYLCQKSVTSRKNDAFCHRRGRKNCILHLHFAGASYIPAHPAAGQRTVRTNTANGVPSRARFAPACSSAAPPGTSPVFLAPPGYSWILLGFPGSSWLSLRKDDQCYGNLSCSSAGPWLCLLGSPGSSWLLTG